ncbi:MAG: homoserine dehydrogenase [Spirochaetales bacterium]|nr:homoserine dehydrogenase [Spirochaetales bacterium]
MEVKKSLGLAVIGCGTVGGAVISQVLNQKAYLTERTGLNLQLLAVVQRSGSTTAARKGIDPKLITENLDEVLQNPAVDIVVELIGGTTTARDSILKSLAAGKHVVTANKALLAQHGAELFAAARKAGKALSFEASCAGGIPIVQTLLSGLAANRIEALYGIVNGTCNYILTEMIRKGTSYAEALAEAQAAGLAEADPTLDVSGGDSAHKLAILSALAFGKKIKFDDIPVQGINNLEVMDVNFGRELGFVIKLLAVAQRKENTLSLRVRPAFIWEDHPLAWISGPFNAVSVYGSAVGHTMYYGRGAGGSPTASAVLADIIATGLGCSQAWFDNLSLWPDVTEPAVQLPVEEIESRYYLRLMLEDKPGILGRVAEILGEYNISISSALQKELPPDRVDKEGVPFVITTHLAREGNVTQAMKKIESLPAVLEPGVIINIIDEHAEAF